MTKRAGIAVVALVAWMGGAPLACLKWPKELDERTWVVEEGDEARFTEDRAACLDDSDWDGDATPQDLNFDECMTERGWARR